MNPKFKVGQAVYMNGRLYIVTGICHKIPGGQFMTTYADLAYLYNLRKPEEWWSEKYPFSEDLLSLKKQVRR
jgi:hypothetical protein